MSSPPKFQHVSELTTPRGAPTASGLPSSEELQAWSRKLVGKKFVEGDSAAADDETFTKASLPKLSRVCRPGVFFTRDYKTERLNVHVNDNDIVTHVTMG
ncbi:hypothetical protein BGX38DRAFT_1151662 [Terfezia claveryi]|nr:hypothetical protein BGX38DRAFT_1151662 [Terfezia claveryi]